MKGSVIRLEDILSITGYIGKKYKDCGIVDEPDYSDVKFEGPFFGTMVMCNVWFAALNGEKCPCMQQASFTVKNFSIRDLYGRLMDRYSGPINFGMEPYVRSNGGARQWYIFDAGIALINISQGSREDFVCVNISKNPNPGYMGEPVLVKYREGLRSPFETRMELKALRYERGILTVSVTNRLGEPSTYSDQYILAKNMDGTGYSHMIKKHLWVDDTEPATYEIQPRETRELACDLRVFGKVEPGSYMLILDDMKTRFELVSEEADTGEIHSEPWFCMECGTKNYDGDVCASCGASKK